MTADGRRRPPAEAGQMATDPCESCGTPVTFVSAAGPIRSLQVTVVGRDETGPQLIGRHDRLPRPVWQAGNGLFEADLRSEWRPQEGGHALVVEFRPHTPGRCQSVRRSRSERGREA